MLWEKGGFIFTADGPYSLFILIPERETWSIHIRPDDINSPDEMLGERGRTSHPPFIWAERLISRHLGRQS